MLQRQTKVRKEVKCIRLLVVRQGSLPKETMSAHLVQTDIYETCLGRMALKSGQDDEPLLFPHCNLTQDQRRIERANFSL